MASVTCSIADQSVSVIRNNMARIKLLTVAGPLLYHGAQANRVVRLLENRQSWGIERPLVMLAVHSDNEQSAAEQFQSGSARDLARYIIVRQKGHNETVGNAIDLFRQKFDPAADPFTAKRQSLYLTRRGGKGKPNFISPFIGGAGTTCGEWTRPMVRNPDGTVIKGFMKASVAVGFCPVACPYCYLNMPYTDGMDVALNWEDLAEELQEKRRRYRYPINFGETSGLVEYDEWFAESDWTLAILNRQGGGMSLTIDDICESSYYRKRICHAVPIRSDHTGAVPFVPLFSHRVWCHAQLLLLGAMLAPGAKTVTPVL
jgi:hypothetical protein